MTAKKSPAVKAAPKSAPVYRSPEVMDAIVAQISEGTPLREICRQQGMPSWVAVYDWVEQDAAFASRFAQARARGFDAIAAESLSIVDAPPERNQFGCVDSGSVAHAKLRAEHRLKLLAKWSPKQYGERLEVESNSTVTHLFDPEQATRMALALANKK